MHNAQRIHMPKAGDKQKRDKAFFADTEKQLRLPFVIYADFESILPKIQGCEGNPSKVTTNTTKDTRHLPCSFGAYIISSDPQFYKEQFIYVGEDAASKFID